MFALTAGKLAGFIGGTVFGDPDVPVRDLVNVRFAGKEDATFAMDEAQLETVRNSNAGSIITTLSVKDFPKTVICVKDMKYALTVAYNVFVEMRPPAKGGIHPNSTVDKTAVFGANVSVGPYAVIGENTKIGNNTVIGANVFIGKNVSIGDNVKIFANASVYDGMIIHNRVILHSGVVVGADGFGYVPKGDKIYKVPQLGSVIIEEDVEIGANTCVDRGTFTDTIVSKGTKIDNLVMIAHNVRLGKNVIIAGQCGIAGSSVIGDNTMMGGQVGIKDHATIGKNNKIAAQAGITKDFPEEGITIFGYPAQEASQATKELAFIRLLFKKAGKIYKLLKLADKYDEPEARK